MKKLRVGILTMHRVHNSGSFLQAYALQNTLESKGCDCVIIDYMYPNAFHRLEIYDAPVSWQGIRNQLFHYLFHRRWKLLYRKWYELRWLILIHQKFKLSEKTYYTVDELTKAYPDYDVYVLGSDQVWNERFMKNDPSFFLAFAPEGKKCVTFASSAPNPKLSADFKMKAETYLPRYEVLSTREKSSAVYLQAILNRKVYDILDPVYLLSKEEWQREVGIKQKKSNYVFIYAMNYMGDCLKKVMAYVDMFAQQSEEIVAYRDGGSLPRCKTIEELMPKDFVQYIANAKCVVTDSYHAIAFSLLFDVPVIPIVADREHDVRIVDLCKRIGEKAEDGSVHCAYPKLEKEKIIQTTILNKIVNGKS